MWLPETKLPLPSGAVHNSQVYWADSKVSSFLQVNTTLGCRTWFCRYKILYVPLLFTVENICKPSYWELLKLNLQSCKDYMWSHLSFTQKYFPSACVSRSGDTVETHTQSQNLTTCVHDCLQLGRLFCIGFSMSLVSTWLPVKNNAHGVIKMLFLWEKKKRGLKRPTCGAGVESLSRVKCFTQLIMRLFKKVDSLQWSPTQTYWTRTFRVGARKCEHLRIPRKIWTQLGVGTSGWWPSPVWGVLPQPLPSVLGVQAWRTDWTTQL